MNDFPSLRLADYLFEWVVPEKCGLTATCPACGFQGVRHAAVHPCTEAKHECNKRGWAQVPNVADVSSPYSLDIAASMFNFLGITAGRQWRPRQTGGQKFEAAVEHFIAQSTGLTVRRGVRLSEYAQYRHLRALGDDDLKLDIGVGRGGVAVALLELKTTLRSDRGRGAVENLRKVNDQCNGRSVPVAAILTAEPDPGRLRAVSPKKTGDRYQVVHVARDALAEAVACLPAGTSQYADWQAAGLYVHDFSDLLADLRRPA